MDNQQKKLKRTDIWKYVIVPALIFLIILFFEIIFIFLLTKHKFGEDIWMCVNGEWVKHGHPDAPMPTEHCGGKKELRCDSYSLAECPAKCVVCPPCIECNSSSIGCQTEEFCKSLGVDWGNDKNFRVDVKNRLKKYNLIRLTTPLPEQKIKNPLRIEGEARGTWFFEGVFPVILTNWDGRIIAEGIAEADGEWMTEDFVKFTAELNFTKPEYGEKGSLILKKDNPSGLPKYDDALEISVIFE